jgi:hypothetical protein
MLLPTMVYWPSSLGKEAWLVFGLGVGSYGAARLLRRLPGGYMLIVVGGFAVYQVRPHMGALFGVTLLLAFGLRAFDPDTRRGAAAWLTGLILVGGGAGYALANFGELLPRDEMTEGSAVDQVFAETNQRTSTGGSEFASRPVESPADFGHALITVPFRPYPNEAHNPQALIASFEGLLLLGLVILSLRRMGSLLGSLLRRPYVAFSAAFSAGFIVAFSNVGNFGILTRQRAQLIPLFAVILCLPTAKMALEQRRERHGVLKYRTTDDVSHLRSKPGERARVGS